MQAYPVLAKLREYATYSLCAFILSIAPTQAEESHKHHAPIPATPPAHGFSPIHTLKYDAGFSHFDYVKPEAPKGGTIRIGRRGTFNSLNLLKYPGSTPLGRHALPLNMERYLYDTLLVASADEAAGYYGLLAKTVEVDPAYRWVRFTLRKDAHWHDGTPITSEDIVFTFETTKKQGLPYFRQVLRFLTIEAQGPHQVTIHAAHPGNRDLVATVGALPIQPKTYWAKNDVTKTTLTPPLGSGPYRITNPKVGRSLSLERVKNYWAANHPVNVGRYNFDKINLEFYRSSTSALEAFKAGDIDIRLETDAVSWATGYEGPALSQKKIRKIAAPSGGPGKIVSLVFNLRRPLFQDRRVRKAFALAYDFEQTNFTLFHKLYEPVASRYGNTEHAAKGAASDAEIKILGPLAKDLPKGFLEKPAPDWRAPHKVSHKVLEEASRLLDEAGIKLKNQKRIDPKTGKPLILSVAYTNPRYQRVLNHYASNLKKLGIELSYPALEPVSASKKVLGHDYDLTFLRWAPTLVPGSSERLLWGSRMADVKRSYALAGAKDPALDAAINAMSRARDWKSLTQAAHIFDRVLRWQVYDMPLWSSSKEWLAHWDKYEGPDTAELKLLTTIDLWWMKSPASKQSNANREVEKGKL